MKSILLFDPVDKTSELEQGEVSNKRFRQRPVPISQSLANIPLVRSLFFSDASTNPASMFPAPTLCKFWDRDDWVFL